MPEPDPLYMHQMALHPRQLAHLGQREGLPPHQDDVEYLVHGQLAALFGEGTVQPFRVMGEGARVRVLGYAERSGEELRRHADEFAEPADHGACEWDDFRSKPMPETWEADRRLGFEVRACPVVRLGRDVEVEGPDGQRRTYRRGAELDAWLHDRFILQPEGPPRSREEVYHGWLADRLAGAARLETTALQGFRRKRLVRKRRAPAGERRRSHVLERPEIVIHGHLRVDDGDRFLDLLRRGVGRHRAFGFGMLLLRPPS